MRRSPLHLELWRILAERRKAAGLSQVQLAHRLKRPQSFVSKLERGERRLDVVELLEVAVALGCQAEDIVTQLKEAPSPRRAPSSQGGDID